ncbi:Holin of 3TMs, for gene-transfer release [Poseidonocella pacifica]|uniref:Holin of 3TMs, for gene-transfer release n=1 Tax=Poseidonocella pacifica TaxID=871651 RepID=A0A1I0VRM1_9RHOB|nr:holin family protein [Poseidonocella pacifica]SFA78888.1 Holin of 3TMs, for gene-transfer release [Poseidonocella pacifica]
MGLIEGVMRLVFGGGRNVVAQTAEVFRVNAEADAQRGFETQAAALNQFGAEFAVPRRGAFDRFMDGLNRLPRPAMAIGTMGLFVAAMIDPIWFAERMQGIALVPEPLWWLLGAIVSFYFGARHQAKGQDFQRSVAESIARVPQVVENTKRLRELRAEGVGTADTNGDQQLAQAALKSTGNPALDDWKRSLV